MEINKFLNLRWLGLGIAWDKYGLQIGITVGKKVTRIWQDAYKNTQLGRGV